MGETKKNEFETIRKFIFLIYKLYSLSNTLAPEVGHSWAPSTPGKNYQCYAERMWSFMKIKLFGWQRPPRARAHAALATHSTGGQPVASYRCLQPQALSHSLSVSRCEDGCVRALSYLCTWAAPRGYLLYSAKLLLLFFVIILLYYYRFS